MKLIVAALLVVGSGLAASVAPAAALDRPVRQVQIEGRVLQVFDTSTGTLGIQWAATFGCPTNPTGCTGPSGTFTSSLTFRIADQCSGPVTGSIVLVFTGPSGGTSTETADLNGVISAPNGVPALGNIPILGNLFRTGRPSTPEKSELLLFITPRIINGGDAVTTSVSGPTTTGGLCTVGTTLGGTAAFAT